MKVLITGITGMVGSHLAEYFLSSFPEIEIHGLVRWRSPLRNIQKILPRVRLHQGDLRDLNSLVVLLREVRPDRIHHLAAQSYVDMSFVAPADTLTSNIIGTVNLMDCGADRRNQPAHSYLLVVGGLTGRSCPTKCRSRNSRHFARQAPTRSRRSART